MIHVSPSSSVPRVLHVVDFPVAGWDALAAARRCAREVQMPQRLLLIGGVDAVNQAGLLGLTADYRLCPTLGTLATAVGPTDALMRRIAHEWPFDLLQVWSDSARLLCRQSLGFDVPIVQEEPWRFAGGIDRFEDRDSARASLGISTDEIALLLAPDRPGNGDARRFAGLVGVLHHAGFNTVGIAPASCEHARRAARFLRGFQREWDVITVGMPPHRLLTAADIVLYDQGDSRQDDAGPGRPGGGIVLAAAALGVPAVTTRSSHARTLFGHANDSMLAPGGLMPQLAIPIWPLTNEPQARSRAAQSLLAHTSSLEMSTQAIAARWRQCVGKVVSA